MCRHLAYLGPPVPLARLLTEPPYGLYEQSWRPRRQRFGTVNADGFGVGWYPPEPDGAAADSSSGGSSSSSDEGSEEVAPLASGPADASPAPDSLDCLGCSDAEERPGDEGLPLPARYRRAVPVWADANFKELARVVRSGAVLAAVRSATEGTTQDESAAAPFRDGRWLFSHNGAVADWTRLPTGLSTAELLALETHSDSALLWAMVTRRLRQGEVPGGALAAVAREVAEARPSARLNFLLTDGRTIAATAWGDTLWYRAAPGAVVVASEPDDALGGALGAWREVPDRSLLLATPAGVRVLALRPERKDTTLMTPEPLSRFTLDDRLPAGYFTDTLHADVRRGLTAAPRTLAPKWFYDKRGSDLFEQITRLPEYYPTRAEQEILVRRAPEIARRTRAATLVELGSGSSRKTRLLLDALTAGGTLRRYAPLDVSSAALEEAGLAVCRDYPDLTVRATVADFESGLPEGDEPGPRLLAFLGSTIGNFDRPQRIAFYRMLARSLTSDDVLLLGADLVKDPEVLVRAYDDSSGITADFNKNVLHVLNRELGADFDPGAFLHVALWNTAEERIEMHLRSTASQTVKIPDLDLTLDLAPGEDVRTELSCKFRRASLTEELREGGFVVRDWWTDPAVRFALLLAVPA